MVPKECKRCGQNKAKDDYYKNKNKPDGMNYAKCKECYREIYNASILKKKLKCKQNIFKSKKIKVKHCQACDKNMSIKYFSKDKSKSCGLRSTCKSCTRMNIMEQNTLKRIGTIHNLDIPICNKLAKFFLNL